MIFYFSGTGNTRWAAQLLASATGERLLFNGTPKWKKDSSCTCCLSCYHHCPVHAISYGRITRKRGQYYFGKR